jgi:hypothetical protein
MKILERIDRLKMELQAAKQALHEADNWTVLATDLEEVSNEYPKGLREKIQSVIDLLQKCFHMAYILVIFKLLNKTFCSNRWYTGNYYFLFLFCLHKMN